MLLLWLLLLFLLSLLILWLLARILRRTHEDRCTKTDMPHSSISTRFPTLAVPAASVRSLRGHNFVSALVVVSSAISSQNKLSDSFHCAESGNPTDCPAGPCLKQGLGPGIGTWLLRRLHDARWHMARQRTKKSRSRSEKEPGRDL